MLAWLESQDIDAVEAVPILSVVIVSTLMVLAKTLDADLDEGLEAIFDGMRNTLAEMKERL